MVPMDKWQLRLLDAFASPILVAEASGRILYQTPALRSYLAAIPVDERRQLERELGEAVAQLSRRLRQILPLDGERPILLRREIGVCQSNYRLRGVLLTSEVMHGLAPGILIEVERVGNGQMRLQDLQPRFGLTQREAEVACLVARGLSDREVASRLSISLRTAEHHTARVLHKFGVASRAALAALLMLGGS
jgi:DNA-binding CsgD family transcriptional regulator